MVPACWIGCLVVVGMWSTGRLDLAFPGTDFVKSHRWSIFAAGSVLAVIIFVIVERRRACPDCGMRPFARVPGADGSTWNETQPQRSQTAKRPEPGN